MPKPKCDLIPMEYNVVIEVDAPSDRIGSILLPPSAVEKERLQADEGWLVAVSPLAFGFDEWPEGSRKPVLGDKVLVGRFVGVTREKDGILWRLVKDKDILAVIEAQDPGDPPYHLTKDEIKAMVAPA
jgi:co-chaperonin GroES (HSP10)